MKKENDTDTLKLLTILLKASTSVTNLLKKDMNSYGLNATEFMVLELLYNKGERSVQKIGQKVLLTSSSISYVIDQLESKRFVKRERARKDRRVILVTLTARGEKLMQEIFPQHSLVIHDLFSDIPVDDLSELADKLKKIGFKANKLHEKVELQENYRKRQ